MSRHDAGLLAEQGGSHALIESLRPIDDELMRCLFRGNLPLVQEVLRIVTGVGDLTLVREETQLDLKRLAGARSLELDVWGVDGEGTWYDIEVQRGDDADARRARYHSAAMDVEALGAGDEFSVLPEQWVVFIMGHDPFGEGRGTYLFERGLAGGTALGDGAHVLYVNGDYRGDDVLGRLMHDFCQCDPGEMGDGPLRDAVEYWKRTPEGVAQMSETMERFLEEFGAEIKAEARAEGRAEGEAKGRQKTLVDSVRSLMKSLGMNAQQAFDAIDVPESERAALLAML